VFRAEAFDLATPEWLLPIEGRALRSVPQLGANGWYCHVRTGAKPVSDEAFAELVNTTSA